MVAHNIFAEMLDRVRRANDDLIAASVLPTGIDVSRVTVEPPRDQAHGDMATNVAMVLAKDAGKKPRELAEAYAAKLRDDALVEKVDIAGPGGKRTVKADDFYHPGFDYTCFRVEHWQRHPGLAELKRDDRRLLAPSFARLGRTARAVADRVDDLWTLESPDAPP